MKKGFIVLMIVVLLYFAINSDFGKKMRGIKEKQMKITIKRKIFTDISTIGEMWIDGKYFCDTLEDKVRDKKIAKITAIPKGTYDTILDFSNRFQKIMPHILNVPNYDGIRIHNGSTAENTDGCILLGKKVKQDNLITDSKKTFAIFMEMLNVFKKAYPNGKIITTIE